MKKYILLLFSLLGLMSCSQTNYDGERNYSHGKDKFVEIQKQRIKFTVYATKLDSNVNKILLKVRFEQYSKEPLYIVFEDGTYDVFYPYYKLQEPNTYIYILIGKGNKLKNKKVRGLLVIGYGECEIRDEDYFIDFYKNQIKP